MTADNDAPAAPVAKKKAKRFNEAIGWSDLLDMASSAPGGSTREVVIDFVNRFRKEFSMDPAGSADGDGPLRAALMSGASVDTIAAHVGFAYPPDILTRIFAVDPAAAFCWLAGDLLRADAMRGSAASPR